jgi:uncharacterized protein (TIGR02284 family)
MDNDDIVDILNDLIETSKDGEYGFRTSAERANTPAVKSLLNSRASACAAAAAELQGFVRQYGGEPEDDGTALGAMHRGWVAVKAAVSTNAKEDHAILSECERGEDKAVAVYRKAAANTGLPADVRAVIERQLQGARANHDQVKAMRDGVRA